MQKILGGQWITVDWARKLWEDRRGLWEDGRFLWDIGEKAVLRWQGAVEVREKIISDCCETDEKL